MLISKIKSSFANQVFLWVLGLDFNFYKIGSSKYMKMSKYHKEQDMSIFCLLEVCNGAKWTPKGFKDQK